MSKDYDPSHWIIVKTRAPEPMPSHKARFALALLSLICLGAHAQRPGVGDTIQVQNLDLYPQPATGRETVPERHAMTRSIQNMRQQACLFTREDVRGLAGKDPMEFRIEEVREVAKSTAFINGQTKSEPQLWIRVVNRHRATCNGWLTRGPAAGVGNLQAAVAAPAAQSAPGQPPGHFCPTAWEPGGLKAGPRGAFKCFAVSGTPIPPGFNCPEGLTLQDHTKTGMLICASR